MSALARDTDPGTSHAAAAGIDADSIAGKVLDELVYCGDYGATSEEIAKHLGMSLVTVSPRLKPLCDRGLACDSLRRRSGSSGHKSTVWIASQFAPPLIAAAKTAIGRRTTQQLKQDRAALLDSVLSLLECLDWSPSDPSRQSVVHRARARVERIKAGMA